MIQNADNPDSINSIVLLTNYTREKIDGPFDFLRDGGQFEVTIPHEALLEANIHPEDLDSFEAGTALALADSRTVGHGEVVGFDRLPDTDEYVIAVDDPLYINPNEVNVDIDEIRS